MRRSADPSSTRPGAPPMAEGGQASKIDRELAHRLRAARAQSALSVSELADAIGVSDQTYQAIERGDRRISSLNLARLAMIHTLPIAWFFENLPGQFIFDRHPADTNKE